jgi:hypothetical protein|tara:strand:+ start:583 stop:1125 length:543 start_codon:yes stop_codon:yes gene_type:complete
MSYFSRFPLFAYDIKNDNNYKLLPDILRRVKLRATIKSGGMLFDKYDVKEGEKPEDVAYKWFGDAELHWVILMTNNITDRYYEWPMNQVQFAEFLTDKYGAGNEDAIHHYEVTQDSGRTTSKGPSDYSHKVEVNSDTDNASSISNREYEERIQDNKRQIQLLDKSLLGDFIAEFDRLIAE